MSAVARLWIDRLEPWINPIVIRSLRQSMRSRTFIAVYCLALTVVALAGSVAASLLDDQNNGQAGYALFVVTVMAWTFAAWFAQPLVAINGVSRERNEETWDLLELTGMRPRALVMGLTLTSLIQSAVVGAAMAPFLVLAYLLRGVDVGELLLALLIVPCGAVVITSLAVFLGCLGNNRPLRALLGGLLSLGLVGVLIGAGTFWSVGVKEVSRTLAAEPESWFALAGFINLLVVITVWLLVLAATLLTHPASERSHSGRLTAWLILLNWTGWFVGSIIWSGIWPEDISVIVGIWSVGAMIWAVVCGFFMITEPEELTRKQQQQLRVTRWRRFSSWLLGSGARRGRRCAVLMIALIFAVTAVNAWMTWNGYDPGSAGVETWLRREVLELSGSALVLAAYAFFTFGVLEPLLRATCGRWLTNAAVRRSGLLAVVAVWMVISSMLGVFWWSMSTANALAALCPLIGFQAVIAFDNDNRGALIMVCIMGLIGLVSLLLRSLPAADHDLTIVGDPNKGRRSE